MPRRQRRLSDEKRASVERILTGMPAPEPFSTSTPTPYRPQTPKLYNFELRRHYDPAHTNAHTRSKIAEVQAALRGSNLGVRLIDEAYVLILPLTTIVRTRQQSRQLQKIAPRDIETGLLAEQPPKSRDSKLVRANGGILVPSMRVGGNWHMGIALSFVDTQITTEKRQAAQSLQHMAGVDGVPINKQTGLIIGTMEATDQEARPALAVMGEVIHHRKFNDLQFALGALMPVEVEG